VFSGLQGKSLFELTFLLISSLASLSSMELLSNFVTSKNEHEEAKNRQLRTDRQRISISSSLSVLASIYYRLPIRPIEPIHRVLGFVRPDN
jgi:hypothetical protein